MVNKNDNNSLKMIFIIYISNKEHTNQPNEPLSVTLKDLFFFFCLTICMLIYLKHLSSIIQYNATLLLKLKFMQI